jgi:hypothetical protein
MGKPKVAEAAKGAEAAEAADRAEGGEGVERAPVIDRVVVGSVEGNVLMRVRMHRVGGLHEGGVYEASVASLLVVASPIGRVFWEGVRALEWSNVRSAMRDRRWLPVPWQRDPHRTMTREELACVTAAWVGAGGTESRAYMALWLLTRIPLEESAYRKADTLQEEALRAALQEVLADARVLRARADTQGQYCVRWGRREHAARIAYLAAHPPAEGQDVIEGDFPSYGPSEGRLIVTDGNHRLAAAHARGDETIPLMLSEGSVRALERRGVVGLLRRRLR